MQTQPDCVEIQSHKLTKKIGEIQSYYEMKLWKVLAGKHSIYRGSWLK